MKNLVRVAFVIITLSNYVYAQLSSFGLEGMTVNCVRALDDVLYAGALDEGVFLRGMRDTGWTSVGFMGKDIRSIYPHHSDGSGYSMLTGIFRSHSGDVHTIYGLGSVGWEPADSGVDHGNTNTISSINGIFLNSSEHEVYATGSWFRLYKRSIGVWENIFDDAIAYVVDISSPIEIWAGGEAGIHNPYVAKSTDAGLTWNPVWLDSLGYYSDGATTTIAIDHSSPNVVYAGGWNGFMVKSTNGGASWSVSTIPLLITRLIVDPLVPTHVFCGGSLGVYGQGGLLETTDGGTNWQQVSLPDTLAGIRDLEIITNDSLDLYIATAGDGVYRLRQFTPAFGIAVNPGWNMVSIPKYVPEYRRSVLFPGSSSGAFAYEGTYRSKDTLENGRGYWIKYASGQFLRIASDLNINADTIDVTAGWNIVGSISKPVLISTITSDPPGIVTSQFYGYQGSYQTTDSIKPGSGYWVKVNQTGKLILTVPGTVTPPLSRIVIRAGEDLPPPPPDGQIRSAEGGPKSEIRNYLTLHQNYPNPFNPITEIGYELPEGGFVSLKLFDVLGKEIATIVDRFESAGSKRVQFDARTLSSGVYYYRLRYGEMTEVRKMLVAK